MRIIGARTASSASQPIQKPKVAQDARKKGSSGYVAQDNWRSKPIWKERRAFDMGQGAFGFAGLVAKTSTFPSGSRMPVSRVPHV
jgi:hypothetical protein